MSRPVTRSMTRKLLAEQQKEEQVKQQLEKEKLKLEQEIKDFAQECENRLNRTINASALFYELGVLTDRPATIKSTCGILMLVNQTLEKFATRELTMTHDNRTISAVGLLRAVRNNCLRFLPDVEAKIKNPTAVFPLWLLQMTQKSCTYSNWTSLGINASTALILLNIINSSRERNNLGLFFYKGIFQLSNKSLNRTLVLC